jgi:hypothetical protein
MTDDPIVRKEDAAKMEYIGLERGITHTFEGTTRVIVNEFKKNMGDSLPLRFHMLEK